MFVLGVLLATFQLVHLAVICVAMAPKKGRETPDGPPPAPFGLGRLVVAALLQTGGVVVAVVAAVLDATERSYPIAWLVLGPAALGLSAFAFALASLGKPRPANRAVDVAATLAFLVGIGITACYGLMFAA